MTKKEQIENGLLHLDGMEFENLLCDLFQKMYDCIHFEHPGKKDESNKPEKSKVDIWFDYLSDGVIKNVFVVATTDKNPFKDGKINDDINKAICYINDGKYSNSKIICSINTTSDPSYVKKYKEICKDYGIDFDLIGLGTITNFLLNKYPLIAEIHLGVEILSGRIIPLKLLNPFEYWHEDFSQDFLYRDSLINDILEQLSIKNRYFVLYGKQGSGKTRIAFELAKRLESSDEFDTFFIRHSDSSITDELKNTLSNNKKVLLVVDDANLYTYIIDVLNFASIHDNTYVVLTTRDYAYESLKSKLDDYFIKPVNINSLSNEQIENIIKKSYPQVSNQQVIKYILNVSKGNLRFAIITTKVILKCDEKYTNLADVLKAFYKGAENELELGNDIEFDNFITALSFFNELDICEPETLKLLSNVFGFDASKIGRYIAKGNEKEIVDIFNDGKVIKISDQIFATYLCYKKIFYYKDISLVDLFNAFFDEYDDRVINLVQSIVDIYFDENEQIYRELNQVYDFLKSSQKIYKITKFLYVFHQLFQNETINYSFNNLITTNDEYINKELIGLLLIQFEDENHYEDIIAKLLVLIKKRADLKKIIIDGVNGYLSIKRISITRDYISQRELLSKINEQKTLDIDILATIANLYISYEHEEYESKKIDHSYTMYRFGLVQTKNYHIFRKQLWIAIKRIVDSNAFKLIAGKYKTIAYINKDNYPLRLVDLDFALELVDKLDLSFFSNKMLALSILEPFRKMDKTKWLFDIIYSDDVMVLYKDFINELTSKRIFGEELKQELKKFLNRFVDNYSLVEFCVKINNLFGKEYNWKVVEVINAGFSIIKERDNDNYDKYLIPYLSKCERIYCNLFNIFKNSNDSIFVYESIKSNGGMASNPYILSPFFLSLDTNHLNEDIVSDALDFFTGSSFVNKRITWGNESAPSLGHYCVIDQLFIYKICFKYREINKLNSHFLENLFYCYEPSVLLSLLNNDLDLLSEIYFAQTKFTNFYDLDLKYALFISNNNDSYYIKCLKLLIETKPDYRQIEILFNDSRFLPCFIELVEKNIKFSILDFSYKMVLHKLPDEIYNYFLDLYISKHKKSTKYLFPISSAIKDRNVCDRLVFLRKCLDHNVSIDILKHICIMDGPSSWSGNYSTYLNEDIDTLNAFINECSHLYSDYYEFLESELKHLKERKDYIEGVEINKNRW